MRLKPMNYRFAQQMTEEAALALFPLWIPQKMM